MPISSQGTNLPVNTAATPAAERFSRTNDHVTSVLSSPANLGAFLESDGGTVQLKDSLSFALTFALVVVGLVAVRHLATRMRSGNFHLLE